MLKKFTAPVFANFVGVLKRQMSKMASGKVKVRQDEFGKVRVNCSETEEPILRFTLDNGAGVSVQIMNYGATITSIKMPGKDGTIKDIVLGFDGIEGYLGANNPYFGATIGRVANRIGKGKFTIDGVEYNVPINNGPNSLHGGLVGFDKLIWDAKVIGEEEPVPKVVFSVLSPDTDQGYPGDLIAQVTYELTPDNQLKFDYQVMATKTTPVGLTNHSYFNLAGDDASQDKLQGTFIQLNADRYTPVDEDLLTTGEILPVKGSIYDFTGNMKDLAAMLATFPRGQNGYDHNFCITLGETKKELRLAGRVQHVPSGRVLEVHTDQPGVQFYSGNFLPDPESSTDEPIVGKNGNKYWQHGAFCLETQNYPNAVNYPHFPNPFLKPGDIYTHSVVYKMYTVQ